MTRFFRIRFALPTALLAGLIFFTASAIAASAVANSPLTVTCPTDGETVETPLALIEGIAPPEAERIVVENLSSDSQDRILAGQTADGRFKILCPLEIGENRLLLATESQRVGITLFYRPKNDSPTVRILWFLDRDTPEPQGDERRKIIGKLDVAARLLQTAAAETGLLADGKTFVPEFNADRTVKVRFFRAERSVAEYRRMTDTARFDAVYREIMLNFPADTARFLVFLPTVSNVAPTVGGRAPAAFGGKIYSATSGSGQRHVEHERSFACGGSPLGGGRLALVGFESFDLWPDRPSDIYSALTDSNALKNRDQESGYRQTRAGAVSTTLGATLHELAHTFGRADSPDGILARRDMMNQGYAHFDRIFLVWEPPSALDDRGKGIAPEDEPLFLPPK